MSALHSCLILPFSVLFFNLYSFFLSFFLSVLTFFYFLPVPYFFFFSFPFLSSSIFSFFLSFFLYVIAFFLFFIPFFLFFASVLGLFSSKSPSLKCSLDKLWQKRERKRRYCKTESFRASISFPLCVVQSQQIERQKYHKDTI